MSKSVAHTVCYFELLNGKLGTTEILLTIRPLSLTVSFILCSASFRQPSKHRSVLRNSLFGNCITKYMAIPQLLQQDHLGSWANSRVTWVPLLLATVQCRNALYISMATWSPASLFWYQQCAGHSNAEGISWLHQSPHKVLTLCHSSHQWVRHGLNTL